MMFSSIRAEIQKMQIQIIDDVITKPILYKTLKVHKIKWYQTWQDAFSIIHVKHLLEHLKTSNVISSVFFSILGVVAQVMKENRSFNLKLICGSRCDMNLFQYWKLLVFNVPSFLSLLNTRSLCKSHNLRKGRLKIKSMVA